MRGAALLSSHRAELASALRKHPSSRREQHAQQTRRRPGTATTKRGLPRRQEAGLRYELRDGAAPPHPSSFVLALSGKNQVKASVCLIVAESPACPRNLYEACSAGPCFGLSRALRSPEGCGHRRPARPARAPVIPKPPLPTRKSRLVPRKRTSCRRISLPKPSSSAASATSSISPTPSGA